MRELGEVRQLSDLTRNAKLFLIALAQSQVEMGNKLINVSTGEGHASLAAAFKKFGRTWHSLSDLGQAQVSIYYFSQLHLFLYLSISKAMSECVMLGDSFGYQGLNAKSAKV